MVVYASPGGLTILYCNQSEWVPIQNSLAGVIGRHYSALGTVRFGGDGPGRVIAGRDSRGTLVRACERKLVARPNIVCCVTRARLPSIGVNYRLIRRARHGVEVQIPPVAGQSSLRVEHMASDFFDFWSNGRVIHN